MDFPLDLRDDREELEAIDLQENGKWDIIFFMKIWNNQGPIKIRFVDPEYSPEHEQVEVWWILASESTQKHPKW